MRFSQGQLIRRRVVKDLQTVLWNALEGELTGYARLEPQETLLLDGTGTGVITFEDGVPVTAFHTGSDTGGPEALSHIGTAGPYRLELYELDPEVLEQIHDGEEFVVPPALPARRLTSDTQLVERTRERAPPERTGSEPGPPEQLAAVEEFLEDSDRIESIRERARTEAESRADEWQFPPGDE